MDNYVIVIARTYGSGGKEIALKLADKLHIPVIDRELLKMASMESGISEEIFNLADEKTRKSFFEKKRQHKYVNIFDSPSSENFMSEENLFDYQAKILLKMAMSESFIVIGRAADYVLRTFPNVLSVNIDAPLDDRIASIIRKFGIEEKQAEKDIKKIDHYRKDYHYYYTGREWGDIDNYDLVLNTGRYNRDKCVELIIQAVEIKLNKSIKET